MTTATVTTTIAMANPRPLLMLAIATLGIWVVNCYSDRQLAKFEGYCDNIKGAVNKVMETGEIDNYLIEFDDFSIDYNDTRMAYFFVVHKRANLDNALEALEKTESSDPSKVNVKDIYYLATDDGMAIDMVGPQTFKLPLNGISLNDIGWVIVYDTHIKSLLAKAVVPMKVIPMSGNKVVSPMHNENNVQLTEWNYNTHHTKGREE